MLVSGVRHYDFIYVYITKLLAQYVLFNAPSSHTVIFLRIFEASLYDRYSHFFQMNLRYKVNNVSKVTLLLNDWSSNPQLFDTRADIFPRDCIISLQGKP